MDNAQKAIMIGVGLFITIIIISVVLLITTTGTNMANTAQDKVGQMDKTLQNQLVAAYDNKVVTGAEVKSLYSQYEGSKDFLLFFEIDDSTNDGKHADADIYYNDNGYANTVTGIARIASTKYVANASGTTPKKISAWLATSGNIVSTKINSSSSYQTYLVKDGENVIGVYARLRNNAALGVLGMADSGL